MIDYLLLVLLAVTVFGIPFKGSFFALTLAALLYVAATTAMGLLISTFMRSQIAAIFGSAVLTIAAGAKILRHARSGILAGGRGRAHQ